jgi:hypothetical protein
MTMAFARRDLASRVVTFFTGVVANERGKGITTAAGRACPPYAKCRLGGPLDPGHGRQPAGP